MSIEVILFCPQCRRQHIDPPDKEDHKTHVCMYCNTVWTPCALETKGVREIPESERTASDTWPIDNKERCRRIMAALDE